MATTQTESVELVEVTPDLAHKWLGHNTHNRNLRERVVKAYASDMCAGAWRWNGESVKFSADGVLLDGQHRLAAIIESNQTISLLVVHGLPAETQETMDGGAKRKFSDVLALRGEHNPIELASIVRQVTLWESGVRRGGSSFTPTNAQLLQTLDKYGWLRDVARESRAIASGSGLPGSVTGLCWWLFSQLDAEDCAFFFERLRDGQQLSKGQPVYELRRSLASSRDGVGERSQSYLTAITIKAWNKFRDGQAVGHLSFRPGGANPEKFPEPK